MKRVVCAVFDAAVQVYGQPFFVRAMGEAMRSFADEVNRKAADNNLAMHPEDFHLSVLAVFDDETGQFSVPDEGIRVLSRGKDVVNKEQ